MKRRIIYPGKVIETPENSEGENRETKPFVIPETKKTKEEPNFEKVKNKIDSKENPDEL